MGKEYTAQEIKALVPHVLRLSTLLTKERDTLPAAYLSGPDMRKAYAAWFLPRNLNKIHRPLAELARHPAGLLDREMLRVLDIGTGPGTAILGMVDFFSHHTPPPALEFTAVDPVRENLAAASDLFHEAVADMPGSKATLATITASAQDLSLPPGQRFDMIILSNSLNEIARDSDDRVAVRCGILRMLINRHLAHSGSCIIIEPALRETSRELLMVRDMLLADGYGIYSPCLCDFPCPALANPKDWCHEELPWEPPPHVKELGRLTGLRPDSLKFSYLVVRRDPPSLADVTGPDSWRVVSEPLRSKGKLEFFVCGAGGRRLVTRLDREKSPDNAEFDRLQRGMTVTFTTAEERGQGIRIHTDTAIAIKG